MDFFYSRAIICLCLLRNLSRHNFTGLKNKLADYLIVHIHQFHLEVEVGVKTIDAERISWILEIGRKLMEEKAKRNQEAI